MTKLDFYKFITDNAIPYRKDENGMIIWVNFHLLESFQELLTIGILADGLSCTLKADAVAFEVQPLSDHFGVDFASAFDI